MTGQTADRIVTNTLPSARRFAETGATAQRAALLVSPDPGDKCVLSRFFLQQQWVLHCTEAIGSALEVLQDHKIPVIITERDLPYGNWKDLLAVTQQLPHAPLLIVVSRLADEYLWSEVLNMGGHDVLAKPFSEAEIRHVLTHAWRISQETGYRVAVAGGS